MLPRLLGEISRAHRRQHARLIPYTLPQQGGGYSAQYHPGVTMFACVSDRDAAMREVPLYGRTGWYMFRGLA